MLVLPMFLEVVMTWSDFRTRKLLTAVAVGAAVVVLVPISAVRGAVEDTLPMASPEEVGMSSERLERVSALMKRNIDDDLLAGTVSLIARHGKVVHFGTYGKMDLARDKEMTEDAIFRIYSMSKAITTAAALMLRLAVWHAGIILPSEDRAKPQ